MALLEGSCQECSRPATRARAPGLTCAWGGDGGASGVHRAGHSVSDGSGAGAPGIHAATRGGGLQRDGGGTTCLISRSTSAGSAWRPRAFLEKIRRPSTSTSNTPPEDWISFTSACGYV